MSDEDSKLPSHRLWQPTTAKWFAAVPLLVKRKLAHDKKQRAAERAAGDDE